MLIIEDKLVSSDLIDQHFVCQLDACKGACCWEGDMGAPISEEEVSIIEAIQHEILPRLSDESRQKIKKIGPWDTFEEDNETFKGTPLLDNGACVYLIREEGKFAQCAFENAYKEGKTDFYKPISCHLYPVRVTESKESNFVALNYDIWNICKAACQQGEKLNIPLYEFVKEALIRKFGAEFYKQLDHAAKVFYKSTE